MNGLSWKNSTAFTSSSMRAVSSAITALSAKCMGAAILAHGANGRMGAFASWEGGDDTHEDDRARGRRRARGPARRAAEGRRRPGGHVSLRRRGRQEIL